MRKRSRLYVCFVDFKKAFDSVNRNKLWQVLKTNGIKGNIFRVVHSMHESVKTCVRVNGECTKYFECPVGLKQGCMLSPVIFSSPVQSTGRAIVVTLASALAIALPLALLFPSRHF